jgi:hypothetical protein
MATPPAAPRRRYEARPLRKHFLGGDDWGIWAVEPDGRERLLATGTRAQCEGYAAHLSARVQARGRD